MVLVYFLILGGFAFRQHLQHALRQALGAAANSSNNLSACAALVVIPVAEALNELVGLAMSADSV